MPHACLDSRFIGPALLETFEILRYGEPAGGRPGLGAEACNMALEAVVQALTEQGDSGTEANLEAEFEQLVTGSPAAMPSISAISRLNRTWRITVLHLLHKSGYKRKPEAKQLLELAEAMVRRRAGRQHIMEADIEVRQPTPPPAPPPSDNAEPRRIGSNKNRRKKALKLERKRQKKCLLAMAEGSPGGSVPPTSEASPAPLPGQGAKKDTQPRRQSALSSLEASPSEEVETPATQQPSSPEWKASRQPSASPDMSSVASPEMPSAPLSDSEYGDSKTRPKKRKRKAPPVGEVAGPIIPLHAVDSKGNDLVIAAGPSKNSIPLSITKAKTKPVKKRYGLSRTVPISAELLRMCGISPEGLDLPSAHPNKAKASKPVVAKDEVGADTAPTFVTPRKRSRLAGDPTEEQPVDHPALHPAVAVKPTPAVAPATIDIPPGAICSSTFVQVLRLVLRLSPPVKAQVAKKVPAPASQPPVWAQVRTYNMVTGASAVSNSQSRQELCEALPYYRSYQAGMYMTNGIAYGYLLDGYPAPRDMWAAGGRVIISHGGGQAVRATDPHGRQVVTLASDHSASDARVGTLLRAAETCTPLVLLAGEGYALLPWNLGCQYVVLGWYWVSAAWFEAEPALPGIDKPEGGRDFFHRLKVRFDWVDSQGEPWWLKEGEGSWMPGQGPTYTPRPDKQDSVEGELDRPAGGEAVGEKVTVKEAGDNSAQPPPGDPEATNVEVAVAVKEGVTVTMKAPSPPVAEPPASAAPTLAAVPPLQPHVQTPAPHLVTPEDTSSPINVDSPLTSVPDSDSDSDSEMSPRQAPNIELRTRQRGPCSSPPPNAKEGVVPSPIVLPPTPPETPLQAKAFPLVSSSSSPSLDGGGSGSSSSSIMATQLEIWKTPARFDMAYLQNGDMVYPTEHPHYATYREIRQDSPMTEDEDESTSDCLSAVHTVNEGALVEPKPTCTVCEMPSPQVYREGWACLQPSCSAFWMLAVSDTSNMTEGSEQPSLLPIPPGTHLTYSPSFLTHTPTPPITRPPYSVAPPLPTGRLGQSATHDDGDGDIGAAGSRSLWRGWVCRSCGRANCRHRWELLECLGCGVRICALTEADILPASALPPPRADIIGEDCEASPSLLMRVQYLPSIEGVAVSYDLPGAGTVYHIKHARTPEADQIWEAYQRAAIRTRHDQPLFQRRALKSKMIKGQMLSQQFAINSGASYKYIVKTLSYSFAEGPGCVVDALDVIKHRVAAVLGTHVPFNEVLSVMYREGQKMSWHDDGETGLGPVVAALSLGSTAVMSFRPKPPKVKRAHSMFASGTKKQPVPGSALDLLLCHGDVVIMAGRQIQFMYDHRVSPRGLRVAATARVINS